MFNVVLMASMEKIMFKVYGTKYWLHCIREVHCAELRLLRRIHISKELNHGCIRNWEFPCAKLRLIMWIHTCNPLDAWDLKSDHDHFTSNACHQFYTVASQHFIFWKVSFTIWIPVPHLSASCFVFNNKSSVAFIICLKPNQTCIRPSAEPCNSWNNCSWTYTERKKSQYLTFNTFLFN